MTMILPLNGIFVFGSNRAGIHGAGAAKLAREKFGAKLGVGEGLIGRAYALPTMDHLIDPLPLSEIALHVINFLECAIEYPDLEFYVTRIGCGLAGHASKEEQIAKFFFNPPENCVFDIEWSNYIQCRTFDGWIGG